MLVWCDPVRASREQIAALVERLGHLEARNRGIDMLSLDRQEASKLILELEKKLAPADRRRKSGGRSRKPIDELPPFRQKLIATLKNDPDDDRHGTKYAYYTGRCRCAVCDSANR